MVLVNPSLSIQNDKTGSISFTNRTGVMRFTFMTFFPPNNWFATKPKETWQLLARAC